MTLKQIQEGREKLAAGRKHPSGMGCLEWQLWLPVNIEALFTTAEDAARYKEALEAVEIALGKISHDALCRLYLDTHGCSCGLEKALKITREALAEREGK